MKTLIYWFRNDLRLVDNPGFLQACGDADYLVPVFIRSPTDKDFTPWGFERKSRLPTEFIDQALGDLTRQLVHAHSNLLYFLGRPEDVLAQLMDELACSAIYCEDIQAPYELAEINALRSKGLTVQTFWQSSMVDPEDLPFKPQAMPDVFTAFRQSIERALLKFTPPVERATKIPALPKIDQASLYHPQESKAHFGGVTGGETQALAHLEQYFARRLPDSYKKTRNELSRFDSSSKFSPWLARGCISARTIAQSLQQYEQIHGANDGTYWLWFELLWRDYFQFLAWKYGKKLFYSQGLNQRPAHAFQKRAMMHWINGTTGEAIVDAGMHELSSTGYLSNRMRQIVASYWIYNLQGHWQAGAAWFESQLIDYDVYSNQGNWLYIAGHGTDPRGGRAFNMAKQTQDHDAAGTYRRTWLK